VKVTVSLKGRFHAFQLARGLQNREALGRLVTSYPRFELMGCFDSWESFPNEPREGSSSGQIILMARKPEQSL